MPSYCVGEKRLGERPVIKVVVRSLGQYDNGRVNLEQQEKITTVESQSILVPLPVDPTPLRYVSVAVCQRERK